MAPGNVSVSVVIAARDEAATIGACISSVGWAREVLVVEDGSLDNTVEVAESSGASVIHNPNSVKPARRDPRGGCETPEPRRARPPRR